VHDEPGQLTDPQRFWGMGEVLKLAVPTSLSMINATAMHFVDGWMVARIQPNGAEALSAQFAAGMLSFAPAALMMGLLGVVNTFVAQNLGARRLDRCSQYTWQGLYLAWAYSLAVLPLALLAGSIFFLFGHAPAVQGMEVTYFRYMICGQAIFLSGRVLEKFFFGIHRPAVVYVTSLVANGVNLVGDYVLIYGMWGFPRLGLQGAAIATLVGAAVGMSMLGAMFMFGKAAGPYKTRTARRVNFKQMRDLLRVGWPAGVQFFIDILGWGLFVTALVGSIQTIGGVPHAKASTAHLAATSVVMRYLHVSFMPAVGIGIALTALVGRYIGAGQSRLVWRRVRAALVLATGYMGLCGLTFWLWRYELVRVFITAGGTRDPVALAYIDEIVSIGGPVMICAAVFQVFDAVGIVFIGALRGAGDTFWPMVVSGTLSVGLIIGGGWFMLAAFPSLESIGVWMAGSAFVIALGVVMFLRFRAGHWRKIDLLGPGGAAALEELSVATPGGEPETDVDTQER